MVDIYGTICYTEGSNYEDSEPMQERIERLNKLFDEGNEIHYWTARGARSVKIGQDLLRHNYKVGELQIYNNKLGKPIMIYG